MWRSEDNVCKSALVAGTTSQTSPSPWAMFMRYQLKQVFVIKNKNKSDKNWHYMVFPVLTLIYVELLKNLKKCISL